MVKVGTWTTLSKMTVALMSSFWIPPVNVKFGKLPDVLSLRGKLTHIMCAITKSFHTNGFRFHLVPCCRISRSILGLEACSHKKLQQ